MAKFPAFKISQSLAGFFSYEGGVVRVKESLQAFK
jgi:hypothetical protein